MHRIDTPTAQPDKFGPGKNGFTGGNPQTGQLPTALDQDFFDALQEEIARVVEGAGLELDKQDHGQMLIALGMLFAEKDATITALSGLATAANKLPYFTGNDKADVTDLTVIGRSILGQDTKDGVLSYLGLGDASKRGVGSGANQIPDMSSFSSLLSETGYQKLPGGLIIQWGLTGASNASTGIATATFPITFPTACLNVSLTEQTTVTGTTPHSGVNCWGLNTTLTTSGFTATCAAKLSNAAAASEAARFIAIGY
ncbi:gp53-like domain-containing protein [Mixta hanseatica]|uniref:Putative tail fiber protein gp53-like C-terminal domain-containing protein n=1 Tax=Mixta hanseatica TaxID=2872648 RepID=A0ABY4RF65_9GAMM|nr:hypothetical protein [Mixta hanseatica]UQY45079.1 hypothetical protein K6958_05190 [Mixta hanseatica]